MTFTLSAAFDTSGTRKTDPVLDALARAPLDDLPESAEEREAVAMAKASRQMKPHSIVEDALEARPAAE